MMKFYRSLRARLVKSGSCALTFAAGFAALVVRPQALAGSHTWTGAGQNNLWSNPANWQNNSRPQPGEANVELRFTDADTNTTVVVDTSGIMIKALSIGGSSASPWTFSSANGARMQLDSAEVRISNSAVFDTSLELVLGGQNVFDFVGWAFEQPITITFAGKVSGSGDLQAFTSTRWEQRPDFRIRFSGNTPNTCSGRTEIWGPVNLELAKLTGPAISGPLDLFAPFQSGFGVWKDEYRAPRTTYFEDHQIGDTTHVRTEGPISLMNHVDQIGALTVSLDALVNSGPLGLLTLGGRLSAVEQIVPGDYTTYIASPPRMIGRLNLGTGNLVLNNREIRVENEMGLRIEAAIMATGSTGIRKLGESLLQLSGSNAFPGTVVIDEGTLRVSHARALGTAAAGTIVNNGAALVIDATGHAIVGESLSLNGGACRSVVPGDIAGPHVATWTGPVTINGGICEFLASPSDAILELSGAISGSGVLAKRGSGSVEFSGSSVNSYTGATQVEEGILNLNRQALCVPGNVVISGGSLRCRRTAVLHTARSLTVNAPGVFDSGGLNHTIGSLAGNGTVVLTNGTLTVGAANTSTTFGGVLYGAAGHFTKTGFGTLIFNGESQLGSHSSVQNGTMLVNSSFQSPLIIQNSGILGGTGTVGQVTVGTGRVSPGPASEPGTLSGGPIQFTSSSRYRVQLNGTAAGSGYDRFVTSSNITLGGCVLEPTLGFASPVGSQFVIMRKDTPGLISGTFSGLPEGATLMLAGAEFRVSYTGGDGNDVVLLQLTQQPTPTMSGIAMPAPGQVQLRGEAAPSSHYVVEASPDLQVWDPIGSFDTDTNGFFQFMDLDAINYPRRFYRLVVPSPD